MKIAFDANIFSLQRAGGISVHFSLLIKYLCSYKDVEIFIFLKKSKYNFCLNNESFLRLQNIKKINFIKYENIFDMRKKINLNKIKILHCTYYNFVFVLLGIKLVYTFHDAAPERFIFKYLTRLYILRIIPRLICFVFADSINFVSQFSFDEYKLFYNFIYKYFSKKIYSISGNYTSFEKPVFSVRSYVNKSKKSFIFTYIGLRGYYKNFLSALNSINYFSKESDNLKITLNIIGGSKLKTKEINILNQSNINYVHHKNIDNQKLNFILSKTDLFIHSSIYEGFGITVLEAMSLKVPTLAIDIPPIRELAGDSIFYTQGSTSNSLFKGILKFVRTPRIIIKRKLEEAFLLSKKFSWEGISKKHYILYQKNLKDL